MYLCIKISRSKQLWDVVVHMRPTFSANIATDVSSDTSVGQLMLASFVSIVL